MKMKNWRATFTKTNLKSHHQVATTQSTAAKKIHLTTWFWIVNGLNQSLKR